MYDGPSVGASTNIGGNNTPDNHFESNIFYSHSITQKLSDGNWPYIPDMQQAARSSLQDMANNNSQKVCYEGLIHYSYPSGGCLFQKFASVQVCSWKDGGSCNTPSCNWALGTTSGNCGLGARILY